MMRSFLAMLSAALLCAAPSSAQQAPSEAAKAVVGAWEISNAARDKTCPVAFSLDAVAGGFKVEVDPACGTAFPSLRGIAAWAMGPNDNVRLMDAKGTVLLDFSEVEAHIYEAERRGEGLYFMRTQAAIKAATVSPEQLFGEWALLQELDKPLCKLALSGAAAGGQAGSQAATQAGGQATGQATGQALRVTVRAGCASAIAGIGFSTWRLDGDELVLIGRSGTWRFTESDSKTWERIPPSTDPMVLARQ